MVLFCCFLDGVLCGSRCSRSIEVLREVGELERCYCGRL